MSLTNIQSTIPWVEKYRPTNFNNIVLDPMNRKIMENIINNKYFPNLLLYGPPGTGKTTTIINLINSFQEKHDQKKKGLMIHLNASDERGIDIIRNQIYNFVNSHTLFNKGIKFVILDEVDYMTKNAQHALKYLLQGINKNVRFCLICNYISRIDESLQNDFLKLRFNQLPEEDIFKFLNVIKEKEKLSISDMTLSSIQKLYKSDIRSMINYIQSNQHIIKDNNVICNLTWENLSLLFQSNNYYKLLNEKLEQISQDYNIEIKNIIKDYLNYIIRYKPNLITIDFLKFTEFIIHLHNPNNEYIKKYTIERLHKLFTNVTHLEM